MRDLAKLMWFVVVLTAALILGPGQAPAEDATAALPAGSKIMIRTTKGELIEAKVVAVRPDSIQLRQGKRVFAVPVAEIQDTWKWRRDVKRGVFLGMGFGAVVGAIEGWALPGDCVSCEDDRGSADIVLHRIMVSAATYGFSGLVSGYLDGTWKVHPGIASSRTTAGGPPFPPWSLSATAGRSWNLDSRQTLTTSTLAAYRNKSPRWAFGYEFGILEFPKRRESEFRFTFRGDSLNGPTPVWHVNQSESSLSYATLSLARARGTQGSAQALFLFGPALYARRVAYFNESRDSLGVVTATTSGSIVRTSFGVTGGFGATFGRGVIRPSVRARGHWILSDNEGIALTVEAGAEFH